MPPPRQLRDCQSTWKLTCDVDTLIDNPTLWPSTELVPSLAQVPDEQLDAGRISVKRTQVGLEKDFKFGMFVMNHHGHDVAEETFELARKEAEDAFETTQDGSMVRHRVYSLCRLGNVYRRQHRYNEAKQILLTALASQEKFGQEPSVFETHNSLGTVYTDLAQLDQAEKYIQEGEMGRKKLSDANKADLQAMINWVKSFHNQVVIRRKQQGNLLEAEEAYENVLREVEKWPQRSKFGLQELQIRTGIGSLYLEEREGETHLEACGRARRAKVAFEKALDARVKKAKAEWAGVDPFFLKHPQSTEPAYLHAIEGLGRARALLGEDSKAQDCFKQAFEGFLTINSVDIGQPAEASAVFYVNRGHPWKAVGLCKS
ncbi:hypothetical protein PV08_09020 [Exophiala spinifera]|uniref:MalT-like TPR region domain-containing protein n=1 Tax=Exophiala spinifera TaxID=91928 RepID=A0A0D2AYF6_9EURO|nr:uncharacterized protein PV08_09020 [Exophiala spinifera]KIW11748.1 hypothetical protein PV08_09020 [Exophiala spinifera]